jgi:hypothetical protein
MKEDPRLRSWKPRMKRKISPTRHKPTVYAINGIIVKVVE